ncbi:MAG: hypothetical protein SFV15_26915 [Polyangiaceae bacterium]|nr:hypothetical protein [Polyangiaceae bacterium]
MASSITFSHNELVARSFCMERRWAIKDGLLIATSLTRIAASGTRREWLQPHSFVTPEGVRPSVVPPSGPPLGPHTVEFTLLDGPESPVHAPAVRACLEVLAAEGSGYCFLVSVFEGSGAIVCRLEQRGSALAERRALGEAESAGASPTGVEVDEQLASVAGIGRDLLESFTCAGFHLNLTVVDLVDQTDIHDTLAFERSFRLCNIEKVSASTCLAALEDPLTEEGLLLVKLAPLPHAQAVRSPADVVTDGLHIQLLGHGFVAPGRGYRWCVLPYEGGRMGRARKLHALQRSLRVPRRGRDGQLISNTWGDRNRDTRISAEFICKEMLHGARLGIDVCEIDDGWEQGITSNSAEARAKNGVWEGYWAADPEYWQPRARTFPDGMAPVVRAAREVNIGLGLWFGPDSSDDFSNWQKDVQACLHMWRSWQVAFIKLDGVKLRSQKSAENFQRFLDTTLRESAGDIIFDMDITAENRPGYLGAIEAGQLFLENRYTDWRRYFPHATLRNIWMLSWYVPPQRLRMEFLNPARNQERFFEDPLAPAQYPPEMLFAVVMATAPLGFFEVSELPPSVVAAWQPIIAIWREHREELQRGSMLPIGECPSGASFTGFCSDTDGVAHVLVYRELTRSAKAQLALPLEGAWAVNTKIAGDGEALLDGTTLHVHLPKALSFAWFRLVRDPRHV